MPFTLPEGDVMSSNATEPTTTMLIVTSVISGQWSVASYNPGYWCYWPLTPDHWPLPFTYFPMISFSFFFVAAGIFLGSVKIACASADPHLHDRPDGIVATVSRITLVAFSAFFSSTATI